MKNLQNSMKIEELEERFEMTVASLDSARCGDDAVVNLK